MGERETLLLFIKKPLALIGVWNGKSPLCVGLTRGFYNLF